MKIILCLMFVLSVASNCFGDYREDILEDITLDNIYVEEKNRMKDLREDHALNENLIRRKKRDIYYD